VENRAASEDGFLVKCVAQRGDAFFLALPIPNLLLFSQHTLTDSLSELRGLAGQSARSYRVARAACPGRARREGTDHCIFYSPGGIEDCVSQAAFEFRPPRRKKPFNLHRFVLNAKLIAVEILSAIVFFIWLYRVFLGEVRLH
jgi:hypothetical protein